MFDFETETLNHRSFAFDFDSFSQFLILHSSHDCGLMFAKSMSCNCVDGIRVTFA